MELGLSDQIEMLVPEFLQAFWNAETADQCKGGWSCDFIDKLNNIYLKIHHFHIYNELKAYETFSRVSYMVVTKLNYGYLEENASLFIYSLEKCNSRIHCFNVKRK